MEPTSYHRRANSRTQTGQHTRDIQETKVKHQEEDTHTEQIKVRNQEDTQARPKPQRVTSRTTRRAHKRVQDRNQPSISNFLIHKTRTTTPEESREEPKVANCNSIKDKSIKIKRERESWVGRGDTIIEPIVGDLNKLLYPDSREGQADQQDPWRRKEPDELVQSVTQSKLEKACKGEVYS